MEGLPDGAQGKALNCEQDGEEITVALSQDWHPGSE
jgi:hypothetical protein